MKQVIVTEQVVRQLVREAFDVKSNSHLALAEEPPVNVNQVVDPSAAVTDPGNENYRPNTPAEFQIAAKTLVSDLPSDKISDTYEKLVKAVSDSQDEKGKKMKKKDTKVESVIRAHVRKMIRESFLSETKDDYSDYLPPAGNTSLQKLTGPLGVKNPSGTVRPLMKIDDMLRKQISMATQSPQKFAEAQAKAHAAARAQIEDELDLDELMAAMTPEERERVDLEMFLKKTATYAQLYEKELTKILNKDPDIKKYVSSTRADIRDLPVRDA